MAAIGRESTRRAIWGAGEHDSIQPFTGAVLGEPGTLPSIRAWTAKHEATIQTKETDGGAAMFNRKADNSTHEAPNQRQSEQPKNGIPAGLPGRQTEHSKRLERIVDDELRRNSQPTGFKAMAIGKDQLPDPLRCALAGFERVTGTRVVIFRNLMPEIADFDCVTVRDGALFISETSAKPLVEKIQKAGFSMDDVAQFLHAQHAQLPTDCPAQPASERATGAEARPIG